MHFRRSSNYTQEGMMYSLNRISLILPLALFLISGCVPKDAPVELKPAYTALEVLTRVQELQKTVIGLYDAQPRQITKANADLIVLFTTSTATILQTSPSGWQQTVATSWMQLKDEYVPTDPKLKVVWSFVDAIIQSLLPVGDK